MANNRETSAHRFARLERKPASTSPSLRPYHTQSDFAVSLSCHLFVRAGDVTSSRDSSSTQRKAITRLGRTSASKRAFVQEAED